MTRKELKAFDNQYDVAFKSYASEVSFPIMNLGKMYAYVKDSVRVGMDIDAAMICAVNLYKVK